MIYMALHALGNQVVFWIQVKGVHVKLPTVELRQNALSEAHNRMDSEIW